MIKIVAAISYVVFVGAGVYLGLSLKPAPKSADESVEPTESTALNKEKKDTAGKMKDKKKKSKKKSDGHGKKKKDEHSENDDFAYMKFSRQFVVPVVSASGQKALVAMDITLEAQPETMEAAYSREPKLRDTLLRSLLRMSNDGLFEKHVIDQEGIDTIRANLLSAAQTVLQDEINDVLILSIAKQELNN